MSMGTASAIRELKGPSSLRSRRRNSILGFPLSAEKETRVEILNEEILCS
jgi:hypothetical protein